MNFLKHNVWPWKRPILRLKFGNWLNWSSRCVFGDSTFQTLCSSLLHRKRLLFFFLNLFFPCLLSSLPSFVEVGVMRCQNLVCSFGRRLECAFWGLNFFISLHLLLPWKKVIWLKKCQIFAFWNRCIYKWINICIQEKWYVPSLKVDFIPGLSDFRITKLEFTSFQLFYPSYKICIFSTNLYPTFISCNYYYVKVDLAH